MARTRVRTPKDETNQRAIQALTRARKGLVDAQAEVVKARRHRDDAIIHLRSLGYTWREIAAHANLSSAQVAQRMASDRAQERAKHTH